MRKIKYSEMKKGDFSIKLINGTVCYFKMEDKLVQILKIPGHDNTVPVTARYNDVLNAEYISTNECGEIKVMLHEAVRLVEEGYRLVVDTTEGWVKLNQALAYDEIDFDESFIIMFNYD